MPRPLLILICVFGFVSPTLVAAATLAPNLIETAHAESPVRLQSLQLSADIGGALAETTVRMVFFNPNSRPLEGMLQFPLLPQQRVSAFALDVAGELRPAVAVAKSRGRQVFEATERRQTDPALLETTQGNNFRLRIYPIPARGTRTVQLKYTESLARVGANRAYRLALGYGDRLEDFTLTLKVSGARAVPRTSGDLGPIQFVRAGDGYRARITRTGFNATGSLDLLLPASRRAQTFVQKRGGETYFITEIPVDAACMPRSLPGVVGLLWDSSGSGAARRHEAELAELDRYFKVLGNAEIRLTRLRDRPEATQTFRLAAGDWSALRAALEQTVYDGASALANWRVESDVGEYLLVSDGLANYGPTRFPRVRPGQRLYALNSAAKADNDLLAALAERSGGRLVQVATQSPGAAARALLTDCPQISQLEANGAKDLAAESPEPRDGLIRIAGRLEGPSATLRLTLSEGGKSRVFTLPVSAAHPAHPLAALLWAHYRLRTLEADHASGRVEIARIGRDFGVPTRETSLVVLDRLDDYVRYDVEPPPAYRAEFEGLKAARAATLRQDRARHMEDLVREFEQKIAWWNRDYPKGDKPPDPPRPAIHRPPLDRLPTPVPAVGVNTGSVTQTADSDPVPAAGIALKKWTPGAPYLARMREARDDAIYAIYLEEKPLYANSSAFFLDAADMLFERGLRDLALRVLSNLVEMDLENRQLLRILGYRLLQAGEPELALPVFEKVRQIAGEEPQSFRDLGLALAAAGQYQQAIDQLYEVVTRPWDNRFAEIGLIAVGELNAIIATAPAGTRLDTGRIDPRLLHNLPLGLRAVLTWDADNTDIDLWVTDPNAEKCYYQERFTYQGGRMSRDFTGGYGPEEFALRLAKPGNYRIEANFYGNRQQVLAGATTLQVKLTTDFGTQRANEQIVTLRLRGTGETLLVGEFAIKAK